MNDRSYVGKFKQCRRVMFIILFSVAFGKILLCGTLRIHKFFFINLIFYPTDSLARLLGFNVK